MFFLARTFPLLNALIAGLTLELALRNPLAYTGLIQLGALLLITGTFTMLHRATSSERLTIGILVVGFFLGISALQFLLSGGWLRHFVAILTALGIWLFLEESYRYIYHPERYHRHALDHLGAFLGVAALASLLSGFFGMRIFLGTRLLLLLPLIFMSSVLISGAVLSTHPMRFGALATTTLLFGMLVTELSWAVSFLPSHYWVNSLIVVIPYYVALHLVRHEIGGTLTSRHLRRYALVSMLALLFVISTAQWII